MRNLVVLLLVTLFFNSCVTIGIVQIEVLKPAKDSLVISDDMVVLSNAYLAQNKVNKAGFKNLVDYDKFRLDSLVSVEALKVVRAELDAAGMFTIGRFDSVDFVMRNNETHIQIKKVDIRSQVETDPVYVASRGEYYAAVLVSYLVQWQVISNGVVLQTKTFQDTVWAEGYRSNFATLADLVNFNEVIKYIIGKTAVEYARYISPTWNTVVRYYLDGGNNDFNRAAFFVSNGNYDDAAELWKKYLLVGDKNISGSAYLNMAVYYELKGDLDEAVVYAKRAFELNNELAGKYLKVLEQRQKEIMFLIQKYNNR